MPDTKPSAFTPATTPFDGTEGWGGHQGATPADRRFAAGLFLPPTPAIKPSLETVANSNTVQDDDHLIRSLLASTFYIIDGHIVFDGATAGDIRAGFRLSSPTGATLNATIIGPVAGAGSSSNNAVIGIIANSGDFISFGAGGASTASRLTLVIRGTVRTGGSATDLIFQWAQASVNATATNVHPDSYLDVWKRPAA